MKLAVGYVRCSTLMQEDSPEQQKKEIQAFAETKGYSIVEWYEDFGKSGTTFEQRPEFQRLKSRIDQKPNFGAVICYDESRWGRSIDSEENTFWRVYFRQRSVAILLVHTSVDQTNEFAPMLSAFEGVQASQYSKKLSELTLRGAKNNGIYSSGGTAAYGYRRLAVNLKLGTERELAQSEWCTRGQEKVRLIPGDEREIEIVRYMFERRALGVACVLIAKELNEKNVPCPKRGKWKNLDQKWSAGTIKSMIENPVFYGARVYNRYSSSKIQARLKGREVQCSVSYPQWRNKREDWVIEEKAHDPLISKEIWEQANKPSSRSKNRSRPHHSASYLLTGLIKCKRCSFNYQGASGMIRGKRYYRYVCGGYNSKRICPSFSINREVIESYVIESVRELISHSLFVQEIEKELLSLFGEEPKSMQIDLEENSGLIAEADKKIVGLTRALEGGVQLDSIIARLKEVEAERNILLEKRKNNGSVCEVKIPTPEEIGEAIAGYLAKFEHRIASASLADRRAVIQACIPQIEVDPDRRAVTVYVRRIPAINSQVENMYKLAEDTAKHGGRLFSNVEVPGAGLEPVRRCRH